MNYRNRRSALATALAALIVVVLTAHLTSPPVALAAPQLDAQLVAGGFSAPVFVTSPPGDTRRLFVVEQVGLIKIINLPSRTVNATPFLDLTNKVSFNGEEGLLGLAFDPNYASNGRFYVFYSAPGGAFGNGISHIAQFLVSANPDIADAGSEATLFTFDKPQTNHNGGWISFSPRLG